jgi:hypothetical protein
MLRLEGCFAAIVDKAPNCIRISPSPVTTSTGRAGWASAIGRLEVDGAAQLVPVDGEEVRALTADKRRPEGAAVISRGGLLDLDDLRPEVAEEHRAKQARNHSGEIEDADASATSFTARSAGFEPVFQP